MILDIKTYSLKLIFIISYRFSILFFFNDKVVVTNNSIFNFFFLNDKVIIQNSSILNFFFKISRCSGQ